MSLIHYFVKVTTYSFKSSGVIRFGATQQASRSVTPPPIGIKTPLEISMNDSDGILKMHRSLGDQLQDNLRNLVQTNWGERLGLYNYGANLGPITTELVSQDDFDSEAIKRINDAVTKWMPYVNLKTFTSNINRNDNKNTAVIDLTITYDIPAIGDQEKKLLVTLYAI